MNDLGFVADAPDVGFVPDSTESNDLGFVPDQQPPLEIDESGLPSNVSPRQRKRLGLMSELAAAQAEDVPIQRRAAFASFLDKPWLPSLKMSDEEAKQASETMRQLQEQNPSGIPGMVPPRINQLPPEFQTTDKGSLEPGLRQDLSRTEPPVVPSDEGRETKALNDAIADAIRGMSSTENLAYIAATMGAGKLGDIGEIIQSAITGTFGVEGAKSAVEAANQLRNATTPEERGQAKANFIVGISMIPGLAHALVPRPIPRPDLQLGHDIGMPGIDVSKLMTPEQAAANRAAVNAAAPGTMRPQEQVEIGSREVPKPPMFEAGDVPFNRMQRFGGQDIPPVEILPQMGRIENVPILEEPRPIEQRETRGKVSYGAGAPVLLRNATEQARQVGLTESAKAAEQVAETTTPKGENKMPPYRAPKPAPTAEQTARVAARESVEKGLTMEMPPMEEAPPEVGQFPEEGGPTGTLSKLQRSRIQAGKQNVRTNVENNPPVKLRTLAQLRDELGRGGERGAIDPTILDDIAEHGRNLLAKGMDFAQWSAEMIKQFGDKIIDHLAPVWRTISETATKGGINASNITEPARIPEHEVRAPVGESPPLRQQGEVAEVQAPTEVQKEVAPTTLPEAAEISKRPVADIETDLAKAREESAQIQSIKPPEPTAPMEEKLNYLNTTAKAKVSAAVKVQALEEGLKMAKDQMDKYKEETAREGESIIRDEVNKIDVTDIKGYETSIAKRLTDLIRRAGRWPNLRAAVPIAFEKVGKAAREQGADINSIKRGIGEELKSTFGNDAPEMVEHYFGRDVSKSPPKPKTLSELGRDLPNAGESGAVHIPFDDIINKVVDRMRKVRDYVTIDPIPRLTRAMGGDIGTGNNSAIQHASARVAVPRIIDDMLAKVFPDQYQNPDAMRKTVEVINKDNILGGYDAFIQQAAAAQTAGHGSAAAHYRQMARDVASAHDLVGYERDVRAAQADPAITENIKRWNDVVNPQLDQLYNEMKGMDANTPRPGRGRIFGARVNLLPKSEEGRWIDALNDEEKPIPSPSSSNYRNPNAKKDKFDRRAKFTGEYSDNPAAVLGNVLSHRWNEVTKIRFLNDLIRSGAGSWEKPADGLIHGKEAKPLPVKLPETKTEMVNGAAVDSATKQMEKTIWVPEDVVSDVRGIIDTDLRLKQNPIARGLTTLQLAQLADAFTHTKNLHSVIANAQGTKAMWSDVVRKMPGLSSLDTAGRITKVLYDITQDTPEIRAEMADMAKNGMLRQHFPATGLQKITKMQDMIHHVDTAARVVMNRFYDNLVDRGLAVDTMPARRKFVQQVGEYNKRLMGPMMQSMSRAGFSPFIVAGRNFNRFGRRMLTGHPGFEATSNSAALKARLVNFTTLGTIFVLPMILNQVLTGNIYGRKGTPIGAVDMNTAVDEKGAHKVLDLASLYGVRRGMRAIGVDSIVEGLRAGDTPDNIVGKAIHDVISTAAHPWAGPALGAAWQTLTGTRLDLRGGPTPVEARKVGDRFSGSQFAENARVALKNQNPMLYSPFRPLFNDTEESAGKDFVKDWFLKTPSTTVGIRDVKSPALSKAGELMGSYQKTPEQEEKSKLKRQLVKSLHEGDKAPLQQARKDKALENRDVEEVKERAKSPLIYMVKKLGAVDAVKVWELADENERKLITPIVNQHILNSTVLDTKEKRKYREQIGTLKPIDK